MNTIRLPAVSPTGRPYTQKLEWGSTDWAADSCLVEWSQFERQWLGVEGASTGPTGRARNADARRLTALLIGVVLLCLASLDGPRGLLLASVKAVLPLLDALIDKAPYGALGFGLLVLAVAAFKLLRRVAATDPARP